VKIAILETGTPPSDLAQGHGRYDAMVHDLLGEGHHYTTFRVFDYELPGSPDAFEGYVITGSSAGVHDGLPWVDNLASFLRAAKGRTKLVGICFGHQVMAHAFGGTVAKAPQGWGLGLHRYVLCGRRAWMDDTASVEVIASHQDQVTGLPPGAAVIGASDFTPNAMIDYGDGAISFQCHPEFTTAFARDLIDAHAAPDMTEATKANARQSLKGKRKTDILARWISCFLSS
jgi:GMP synthase-like glutamine amidotransferase